MWQQSGRSTLTDRIRPTESKWMDSCTIPYWIFLFEREYTSFIFIWLMKYYCRCSNTTSMYHARRIDGRNRMIVVRKGTKVSCRERGILGLYISSSINCLVTQSSTRSPLPTLHEKVASVLLPLALLLALLMVSRTAIPRSRDVRPIPIPN